MEWDPNFRHPLCKVTCGSEANQMRSNVEVGTVLTHATQVKKLCNKRAFYFSNSIPVLFLQAAPSTTPLSMSSVDGMIGVSTEVGGGVFDPLGLAELHTINPLVNPHPKVRYSCRFNHAFPGGIK